MSRTYNKFNSTRAKAEFARNAYAGALVAADSSLNIHAGNGSTTTWADADTKVTLNTGTGVYGDAGDWSVTDGGNITLQPGTYEVQWRIAVKNTAASAATVHWGLTDDAYAVIVQSAVTTPLIISNQNENGYLMGYAQFELAEETECLAHVGVSGAQVVTKIRSENSQVIFRKLA